MKKAKKRLSSGFCLASGKGFRLTDHDPAATGGIDKANAAATLQKAIERMRELQSRLYAENRWALLLIFQAMDAAGKDSVIKHVLSGINPQGCQVYSFKAPSAEDLDHDYLWRTSRLLPERGRIGIFNRSYYEEVLIARVHNEILQQQKLPAALVTEKIWTERFEDINAHERYLSRNGMVICKFFLHLSRDEQKKRFLARIDNPQKNWKFSQADVRERSRWDEYMHAYEEAIRHTATPHAPWHVVPADNKWFTRLVVADAIVAALEAIDPHFPTVNGEQRQELAAARALLAKETD